MATHVQFHVGETLHTVRQDDVTPETTLNEYLRHRSHLTGTKRSCLEGGCGCCVVAVEFLDRKTHTKRVQAVNSCLVSIFQCHGWKIHTNEGIGSPRTKLHPLQEALATGNGSQCGFCSSGMVMNMYALTENGPVTQQQIEDSFSGNICRCTGYRAILQTFRKFAVSDIEDFKPCRKENCKASCPEPCTDTILFEGFADAPKFKWMKVYLFGDLLETLGSLNKTYMLVGGNTAKGVYKNDPLPGVYIDVTSVKELTTWTSTSSILLIGGNVSLNETINIFRNVAQSNTDFGYLAKMADHIELVANVPVRNIGTIAGNLMIKHIHREFLSDIFLILETVDAKLVIVDPTGNERHMTPAQFLQDTMKKKVIKTVILKSYPKQWLYTSYKIMPRAQNTHAVVNAGFLFEMAGENVSDCRIVYGGINSAFVHASATEAFLKGKQLYNNTTLQGAFKSLDTELKPDYVLPDATPEYRKNLAISLFYKCVLGWAPQNRITSKNKSGGDLLQRPLSTGSQEFALHKEFYPVGEPLIKTEALDQTSGTAEYIEDQPDLPGQLFAAFVQAQCPANSTITTIDASAALKLPGVVAFMDKNDIPGKNNFTPLNTTPLFSVAEELFCSGTVRYYHQPVGIVVATSEQLAWQAAKLVKVNFKAGADKPLLHIRDVLQAAPSVKSARVIHLSDMVAKRTGTDVKKQISGEFYVDLQYHFHMELQVCHVVPQEDGLVVFSATQYMDAVQMGIANILGILENKITVVVRRLGGSYGGKILRCGFVAAAAALAAYKLNKPIKMRLPMEDNMEILGKRLPCLVQYTVKVNADGVIQDMDSSIYSDVGIGGNEPVNLVVLSSFQSGYLTDTWNFSTYTVATDTHANAWCRAPGAVESTGAIEQIMEHIAYEMNLDPLQVRKNNLDPKFTILANITADVETWSNLAQRRQQVQQFNSSNRWKKRGLSVIPMSWTIEVASNFTVQVSVYHGDGSVCVVHGGIEMGQGVNTKVRQVVAYKLGIPLEWISVKPTNSVTCPNGFASGGSLTSEACCWAAIKACDVLLERLKPLRTGNPSWKDLIALAHTDNVHLNASSLYYADGKQIVNYPVFGVAAVEVEVDILTGQFQNISTDLIEDVGDSMNPLIDVGQLEGAFVMGSGYHTTEQIIYNDEGKLLTNRTWNYLPPGAKDIPQSFRVKFPSNTANNVGVLHSKAIAEPPCSLTVSVPLAIRRAVASARTDAGNAVQFYAINGCSTIEQTFLNSANDFKQYTL